MKRRWLLAATAIVFAVLVALDLWDVMTPIPLVGIVWTAPKPITESVVCDLDSDNRDELVIKADRWWRLSIVDGQWHYEPISIPAGWSIAFFSHEIANRVLLLHDLRGWLWALHYREGWHWQRLVPFSLLSSGEFGDWDRDGQEDDLLVIHDPNGPVWWFEFQTDGRAVLRDKLTLQKRSYLFLSDIEVWKGKLRVIRQRQDYDFVSTYPLPDMDGDDEEEIVRIVRTEPFELELTASRTNKSQRLKVPMEWLENLARRSHELLSDLDGDGRKELLLLGQWHKRIFLMLLHYDGISWRHEIVPFPIEDDDPDFVSLWVMQVGKSERVITNGDQMIWHDGKRWRQRKWRFQETPDHLWQDSDGWRLAIFCYRWLDDYPLWRALRRWCLRIRDWGLPIPIPPGAIHWTEVWRWDEKGFDWRWEGNFPLGGYPDLNYGDRFLDLNGDGRKEALIVEEHSLTFATLAVKVGRWRKRWKAVHLWGNEPYDRTLHQLRDGKCIWIVSVKRKHVQAWTVK